MFCSVVHMYVLIFEHFVWQKWVVSEVTQFTDNDLDYVYDETKPFSKVGKCIFEQGLEYWWCQWIIDDMSLICMCEFFLREGSK